jgi:integrase
MSEYHDIVDLADILGHTSIETTRIYTRTSRREKQERINALNL